MAVSGNLEKQEAWNIYIIVKNPEQLQRQDVRTWIAS